MKNSFPLVFHLSDVEIDLVQLPLPKEDLHSSGDKRETGAFTVCK